MIRFHLAVLFFLLMSSIRTSDARIRSNRILPDDRRLRSSLLGFLLHSTAQQHSDDAPLEPSLAAEESLSTEQQEDPTEPSFLEESSVALRGLSAPPPCRASYAFERQFAVDLKVALDWTPAHQRLFEQVFLMDYNSVATCGNRRRDYDRYLTNVTIVNATHSQDTVRLQGAALGFCRGCGPDPTLFARSFDSCLCDGISKDSFQTALNATLIELVDSRSLPQGTELERITELVLSQECLASNRTNFTATSVLDFETLGVVNVGQETENTLADVLQRAFRVLTSMSSTDVCDPFAYDISSIEILGTLAGASRRRALFRKVGTKEDTPTTDRLLDSTTLTPSQVPTASPAPTITNMPSVSSMPSVQPSLAISVSFSVAFVVAGSCRGCESNSFLGNDVSGRRLQLPAGRSLMEDETAMDEGLDCLCGDDAQVRTLNGNEFATSVTELAQDEEDLSFIVNADEVYEVDVVACAPTFTTILVPAQVEQIFITLNATLTTREKNILGRVFAGAYNEAAERYCDLSFPEVPSATVVNVTQISDPTGYPPVAEHSVAFQVQFDYRNNGGQPPELFAGEAGIDSDRRLAENDRVRRVMIQDETCFCAVDAVGDGAPPYDAFLQVFYDKLEFLISKGAFRNIQLEPTSVPTSLIIYDEISGAPSVTASDFPSDVPSNRPTVTPPTRVPTVSPQPSRSPSSSPSAAPTSSPTGDPTKAPSVSPSYSASPSDPPSQVPSQSPKPSTSPTVLPTSSPEPSSTPTSLPSLSPAPSVSPSEVPSASPQPSQSPSELPSTSVKPSTSPSELPSASPVPSDSPSQAPSDIRVVEPFVNELRTWSVINPNSAVIDFVEIASSARWDMTDYHVCFYSVSSAGALTLVPQVGENVATQSTQLVGPSMKLTLYSYPSAGFFRATFPDDGFLQLRLERYFCGSGDVQQELRAWIRPEDYDIFTSRGNANLQSYQLTGSCLEELSPIYSKKSSPGATNNDESFEACGF